MTESGPPNTTPVVRPDFSAENDEDLLVYMSWKDDEPDSACAALGEFYKRHVRYLHAVCFRAHGQSLQASGVKDLVTSTFQRAYERASSFKPSCLADPDRMRRRVHAWLGRIAHRIAQDAYRGKKERPEQLLSPEHWADIPARPTLDCQNDGIPLVQQGMDTILSEREREVLRVTMQFYDPEREHQRLPDDIAAELAARLGTTSDNLRKIRSTAMQKMKEFLVANMAGSASKG